MPLRHTPTFLPAGGRRACALAPQLLAGAAQDAAGGLRGGWVRQVPVLRPVLHVDGVAGLGPTDTTALVSGHHQCHSAARCGVQLQPAQPITGSPEAWFLE